MPAFGDFRSDKRLSLLTLDHHIAELETEVASLRADKEAGWTATGRDGKLAYSVVVIQETFEQLEGRVAALTVDEGKKLARKVDDLASDKLSKLKKETGKTLIYWIMSMEDVPQERTFEIYEFVRGMNDGFASGMGASMVVSSYEDGEKKSATLINHHLLHSSCETVLLVGYTLQDGHDKKLQELDLSTIKRPSPPFKVKIGGPGYVRKVSDSDSSFTAKAKELLPQYGHDYDLTGAQIFELRRALRTLPCRDYEDGFCDKADDCLYRETSSFLFVLEG
ncbi:hypothetical protein MNV49_003283 [Pseudohyphozyma bogoriensis]|nr:hypothetical protein MNV49_003283 [Pseudohyphozyma bogoriensis]